jgi:GTPase
MFNTSEERPKVERALLVGIAFPDGSTDESTTLLNELKELVLNLHIEVMGTQLVKCRQPNVRYLLGTGKAQEVVDTVKKNNFDCIVFDNELTPAQQRNWEELSGVRVIDRQGVILDIFAERAHTKAAVLQVECARLEYALPRLKRAWTHLSRQHGGGITQRGEGEMQLELDRRIIRKQISRVKEELDLVVKQRSIQRSQRMRVPMATGALVGYTNSGKSSLLNKLTGSDVLVENKLFATLDPTTRRLQLPTGQKLLLTDTVGFVRRLPHHLVDAFKATLEEAVLSDFLIHLIDISSPDIERHIGTTLRVLNELGATNKKVITVFNKIDLVKDNVLLAGLRMRHPEAIFISTHTKEGIDQLIAKISSILEHGIEHMELLIPHNRYDIVSSLHRAGAVQKETPISEGVYIKGIIPDRMINALLPYKIDHNRVQSLHLYPGGDS